MSIRKVLFIADDPLVRTSLENSLGGHPYSLYFCSSLADAQPLLVRGEVDIVFVDARLPDPATTNLLDFIHSLPDCPLTIITIGYANLEFAIDCVKNGAFDYIIKPFSEEQVEATLERAERFIQLRKLIQFLIEGREEEEHALLGPSAAMQNVRALMTKLASTESSVLIEGEKGTGKQALALALHRQSKRNNTPLIRVHCGANPQSLVEADLFGNGSTPASGTQAKHVPRIELAHRGTLLLEEISQMSPEVQARLVQTMQEQKTEHLNGDGLRGLNIRFLATTSLDLEACVKRKQFRHDLFLRLSTVTIKLPPLRERLEDIPLLAEIFIKRLGRRHEVPVRWLSDKALRVLRSHTWPGNLPELERTLERAVMLCSAESLIDPVDLGFTSKASPYQRNDATRPLVGANFDRSVPWLSEVERRHILSVLEFCKGNRTKAAHLLGISSRTLRNRLNSYNRASGLLEEKVETVDYGTVAAVP